MPNWCDNYLCVSGTRDNLERFLKRIKGRNGDLDFNKVVPYPKEYKQKDKIARDWNERYRKADPLTREKMVAENKGDWHMKDGYNEGGYDWCCRNWGTKWNASNISLEAIHPIERPTDPRKRYSTCIEFDTAWSPPIPIVMKLSKMFPDLNFELSFQEEGVGFKGEIVVEDSEIISAFEEEMEYDEDYVIIS